MKKLISQALLLLACICISSISARASQTFEAILNGANEVSPTASPATGFGTVVLNDAQDTITVDESWTGLVAPATATHIHGPAAVGVNAAVIFAFTGVPFATSGSIPEQSFAISPTQVADLQAGLYYMNIHNSVFPGGEIRGQLILVPEPTSLALLSLAAGALLRRRPHPRASK